LLGVLLGGRVVSVAGRLAGGSKEGACWLLGPNQRALVLVEVGGLVLAGLLVQAVVHGRLVVVVVVVEVEVVVEMVVVVVVVGRVVGGGGGGSHGGQTAGLGQRVGDGRPAGGRVGVVRARRLGRVRALLQAGVLLRVRHCVRQCVRMCVRMCVRVRVRVHCAQRQARPI